MTDQFKPMFDIVRTARDWIAVQKPAVRERTPWNLCAKLCDEIDYLRAQLNTRRNRSNELQRIQELEAEVAKLREHIKASRLRALDKLSELDQELGLV